MNDTLRQYFDDGIGATITAVKTRISEDTVRKYFKKWTAQIVEQQDQSFFDREIEARETTINSMDQRMVKLITILNKIEKRIEKDPIPQDEDRAIKINHELAILRLHKGAIEMKAPSKYRLQREVDQFISQTISKHDP